MGYKHTQWRWINTLMLSVLLMIPMVMCAMKQEEEEKIKGFNLIEAFRHCHRNIVNYLMENKIDLMWASMSGNKKVVDSLIKRGTHINATDKNGFTALMWASGNGSTKVVDSLIKNGVYINTVDNDGFIALMLASLNGNKEVVDNLIKNGANPYIKNKKRKNSLDLAEDNEKLKKHIIKKRSEYVTKKYKEYLADGKNRMEVLAGLLQKEYDWYKPYWDEDKGNHDEQQVKQSYSFPKDIAGVIAKFTHEISDDEWAQMCRDGNG